MKTLMLGSSKKVIFLLVGFTFIIISCTKKERKNDLDLLELNGKVKSISISESLGLIKFGEIQKGAFIPNNIELFDKNGNKIESTGYTKSDGSVSWKEIMKYNENRNLIERVDFNSGNRLSGKFTFFYNEWRDMVEENKYNSDGGLGYRIKYKYDGNKNIVQKNQYNSDGELNYSISYIYDKKKNIIQSIQYNSAGELVESTTNKYDLKGKITETDFSEPGRKFESKHVYKYNEKGRLIEDSFTTNADKFLNNDDYKQTIQYDKFDKFDNWLIKYESSSNYIGSITEREIEYY